MLRERLYRFEDTVQRLQEAGGKLPTAAEAREAIGADPDINCGIKALRTLLRVRGYDDEDLSMILGRFRVPRATTRVSGAHPSIDDGGREGRLAVWLYFWERPDDCLQVWYSGPLRIPRYQKVGYVSYYVLILNNRALAAGQLVSARKGGTVTIPEAPKP
ncbi:hypothetical protein LCGC14_2402040 [marine sediment metagenome]|uniref:Uncharacterized protein n=1 Tax=marine sediment metagenome TaxID=412755 RepID=A0A0F9E7F3_9ZZZZ